MVTGWKVYTIHKYRWLQLNWQKKILGDLENNATIDIIILNTKKVLYLSKLDKKEPHLKQVQSNVKNVYNHDL